MNFYAPGNATSINLREQFHYVLFGAPNITAQGKQIILRRFLDQTCSACWDVTSGGSSRPNCPYCGGEGYMWSETLETVYMAHGVAPVYKPGILGTGQYPQQSYGYTDPNKMTVYMEYSVYPNYERYTLQTAPKYDIFYELKVDAVGNTVYPTVRAGKWKLLSLTPMYGDFGRVEFIECGAEKINI